MPEWLNKRKFRLHFIWTLIAFVAASLLLLRLHWAIGAAALVVTAVHAFITYRHQEQERQEITAYINTLSHRVKRASHEVIHEMPIGIVLYDEEKRIEWHNPYISKIAERDTLVGESVATLWPALKTEAKGKETAVDMSFGKRMFRVTKKPEERLLFFVDTTAYANLAKKYEEEKIVIGLLVLDNVEEVTQGMDDQVRSMTMAQIAAVINDWAVRNQIYLRRTASDRFFLLFTRKELVQLEQNRFDILDEVKDATAHLKLPVTLSIGVAGEAEDLIMLGQLAQTSLDIALGRGGDQAAVKVGNQVNFFGGKTNAVEKRTRVRARVVSHALRDLIRESDNVVIMGHKIPDMDSLGAAIGVQRAAEALGKQAVIVLESVNPSIKRLMEFIKENEELTSVFVSPDAAMNFINERSLAVVVDTHKASLVAEPKLLGMTDRLVVIDHHRRGEEFLSDATLIYMEPYASSACELVTELLQYIQEGLTLDVFESTALLAGIVTDTKSFSVRTGARTFEAASFLRRNGADSGLIQQLLKDDLQDYLQKADIIRHAQIVHERFAIAAAEPGEKHSQLLIAQVADTLLNMKGITASFVVSERQDGMICISARSTGEVNVQLIMEQLGGGGHLTNAATQLEGDVGTVKQKLLKILDEYKEREGTPE